MGELTRSTIQSEAAFIKARQVMPGGESLLVQAGSGALTLGVPSSPGIPASITSNTLLVPYNDLKAAEELFAKYGKEIACFAVEPVAGNMGLVLPATGYLEGLRALCSAHGVM